jgi:hypothetical protein
MILGQGGHVCSRRLQRARLIFSSVYNTPFGHQGFNPRANLPESFPAQHIDQKRAREMLFSFIRTPLELSGRSTTLKSGTTYKTIISQQTS